jgi:hypothetical protein
MKKLSVLAFACVLVCDTVSPVTTYAQLTDLTSAANRQTARAISKLLQKYPRGGDEMVLATERLVEINAASTTAIVAAASNMNPEQKAAVEQAIAQAVGLLGKCDTNGHCGSEAAQEIQDYLDNNKSDPIVAAILIEEVALGSIGNQGSGGGSGAGGGGFSGGAGPAISPS